MNEELKAKLEKAIAACAVKATENNTTALEALQYTQAAVNASNAIIGLSHLTKQSEVK